MTSKFTIIQQVSITPLSETLCPVPEWQAKLQMETYKVKEASHDVIAFNPHKNPISDSPKQIAKRYQYKIGDKVLVQDKIILLSTSVLTNVIENKALEKIGIHR